jgi:hypothetical protein
MQLCKGTYLQVAIQVSLTCSDDQLLKKCFDDESQVRSLLPPLSNSSVKPQDLAKDQQPF